jgi:hypothetical protein
MEFREQITIGIVYFVFAYFATLGFWQLLATWQRLRALWWLGRRIRSTPGYCLGATLIVAACIWFFGSRSEEIFSPGPASSEFLFFFSSALLCSLVTTLLVAGALRRLAVGGEKWCPALAHRRKESVLLGEVEGFLLVPSSTGGPWPAICMVPAPGEGRGALDTIGGRLVKEGFVVLHAALASDDAWAYPDVLALFPRAMAYLQGRGEADARAIGALGVGLGGDLAIRAASSDPQIKSVVAIAPLLEGSNVRPGVDLLRENSLSEARRWVRLHKGGKLVDQVAALEHMPEFGPRSLLVVCGEDDRLITVTGMSAVRRNGKLSKIAGQGRQGLVDEPQVISSVLRWFRKSL